MAERIYQPNEQVLMTPIEGLRFYADALRGDWTIDGRSEKAGLNAYISWAAEVDAASTTEAEVLAALRTHLDVEVVESFNYPDDHDRRGMWSRYAEELAE